jgi:hypothetical protein
LRFRPKRVRDTPNFCVLDLVDQAIAACRAVLDALLTK